MRLPANRRQLFALAALGLAILIISQPISAQEFTYDDSWTDQVLALDAATGAGVEVTFSVARWSLGEIQLEGRTQRTISVPGLLLQNEAGAPNLPGFARFVALPGGSQASFRITASRLEVIMDVEIAPAPRIPFETEDDLVYERDLALYNTNAFYPTEVVQLSSVKSIRGVDAVVLGISPFQYNPVTRELRIYHDLKIAVDFDGGDGRFGDDRLRNRWWDPILDDLLVNAEILPRVDYDQRPATRDEGFEYVIICPDDPDFIAWANTLREFRNEQGILTGVFTTAEIGGNTTTAIESFVDDAYENWTIPPVAVLLLGDYGTGNTGIIAPVWAGYCKSDNIYADVDGDDLPDIIFARITARHAADLETMVGKALDYELQPPTNPGFYQNPIIAGGWQTERWFILCDEVLLGYLANVHGKTPVREYAIYDGTPSTIWSSATNTSAVVNYFGPAGLGYIPSTPMALNDWGGNATRINADINAGAFILQHRDHGNVTGWGEPYYQSSHLSGLSNQDLTFVFSINCLTGKYDTGECFTEVFHRHANGALGLIAASEISYSFVNDVYVWGMYDYFWPDFDPGYGSPGGHDLKPAFGNAVGKYYLEVSNWPYNTQHKVYTDHLFHHHGDAFLTVYSEVPQPLNVAHDPTLLSDVDFFNVTADAGALIGVAVDGELIGSATATGSPQTVTVTPQQPGSNVVLTVTKQNYLRFRVELPIVPPDGPYIVYSDCVIDDSASGNGDGLLDHGEEVALDVTLRNVGSEDALGVTGTLTTEHPQVTLVNAAANFDDIAAGGEATTTGAFTLAVAGDIADGEVIDFTLEVVVASTSYTSHFQLTALAPVLQTTGITVNDAAGGDASGDADAGETVLLSVVLNNTGQSATSDLVGVLSSGDPYLVILDAEGSCSGVAPAEEAVVASFQVEILAECPEPTNLALQLALTGTNGFHATLDFELPVGGWFDELEADRGWTAGVADDNAASAHWELVDPIGTSYDGHILQPEDDHTPTPGHQCYITGNGSVGGAAGENDVDGGKTTLLTPVFDLEGATSATISYWRWYSNSWGNDPDNDWWDVEVTVDGSQWVSLEHTQQTEAAWVQMTFELGDYIAFSDQVQIRFVAADEGDGSLVEAGVDDFLLDVVRPISTDVADDERAPSRLALGAAYPNPFNPKTTIHFDLPRTGRVELTVFDVMGRKVATLVNGELPSGRHQVAWLGRDGGGRQVASGLYFYRLISEGQTLTRKMTLLK